MKDSDFEKAESTMKEKLPKLLSSFDAMLSLIPVASLALCISDTHESDPEFFYSQLGQLKRISAELKDAASHVDRAIEMFYERKNKKSNAAQATA